MSLCYNSYDREDFLAEFLHQLFRVDWADAFDQAAAEVFLNALPRRGRAALEKRGFKLQSVLFVLHPVALSSNPLARVDARKGSNHRYQLPVALHLYTQHRKPRLFAVEGDASINPENPSCGGDGGGVFTLQSVSMEARRCHRGRK